MPGDTGAVIRRALAAYKPKLTLSHDCSVLLDAAVYQGREADLDSFLQTARSLNLAVGHPSVGAFLDPRTTALSPKDLAFIEKLLRAGAKPDQKGRYAPPLVWAAMHDDLKLATLLLAHRADPNSVLLLDDTLRCTPLAAAAARDSVPMAKLLLASGATTARPFLLDGRCAAVEQRHDAGGLTLSAKMRALLPKL